MEQLKITYNDGIQDIVETYVDVDMVRGISFKLGDGYVALSENPDENSTRIKITQGNKSWWIQKKRVANPKEEEKKEFLFAEAGDPFTVTRDGKYTFEWDLDRDGYRLEYYDPNNVYVFSKGDKLSYEIIPIEAGFSLMGPQQYRYTLAVAIGYATLFRGEGFKTQAEAYAVWNKIHQTGKITLVG